MAKVYTRTGDRGKTSLYTGERVSKGSLRVETYGTVDEADSVLGEARAFAVHDNVKETIYKLQKELWLLMADVASVGKEPNITADRIPDALGPFPGSRRYPEFLLPRRSPHRGAPCRKKHVAPERDRRCS